MVGPIVSLQYIIGAGHLRLCRIKEYKVMTVIQAKLAEIFSEQELAIIWAALVAYDVGPEEANPQAYKELEAIRLYLIEVFE
jgi:hypothetical protein